MPTKRASIIAGSKAAAAISESVSTPSNRESARLRAMQKFGSMSGMKSAMARFDRTVRTNDMIARFDLSGQTVPVRRKDWRMRLYDLINDPKSGPAGAVTYIILMSLVLLSSVVLCLGTLPEFRDNEPIEAIEWFCAIAFSIELVLRVVSWQEAWRTMLFSGTLYVDVLSVVPFFITKGIEMGSSVDEIGSGVDSEGTNSGVQVIGVLRSSASGKVGRGRNAATGPCAFGPRARPRPPRPFPPPARLGLSGRVVRAVCCGCCVCSSWSDTTRARQCWPTRSSAPSPRCSCRSSSSASCASAWRASSTTSRGYAARPTQLQPPESAGCGAEGRGGAGREGRGERRGGRGARAEGARRRRPGTARCVLRAVCGAQSPHVPPVALRRCCTRTKTSTTSSRRRGSSS